MIMCLQKMQENMKWYKYRINGISRFIFEAFAKGLHNPFLHLYNMFLPLINFILTLERGWMIASITVTIEVIPFIISSCLLSLKWTSFKLRWRYLKFSYMKLIMLASWPWMVATDSSSNRHLFFGLQLDFEMSSLKH